VGISGFTAAAEARAALAHFRGVGLAAAGWLLGVGVLTSTKTLLGRSNRWPLRYPRSVSDVETIFLDEPEVLNVVHVSHDPTLGVPVLVDLQRGLSAGGSLCHGLQINGLALWDAPTPRQRLDEMWGLAMFRERHPDIRVVLQVRPGETAAHDAGGIRMVAGLVTDVLLDPSGGQGRQSAFDGVGLAARCVEIREACPSVRVGVAGGLDAALVEQYEPTPLGYLWRNREASSDAEGRLRDDEPGGGRLVAENVRAYLEAMARCGGAAGVPV